MYSHVVWIKGLIRIFLWKNYLDKGVSRDCMLNNLKFPLTYMVMQKTEFTDVPAWLIFVVASASRMQSLVTKINSWIQTKVIPKSTRRKTRGY